MKSNYRFRRCYTYHFVSSIKPLFVFLVIFVLVDFGLPALARMIQPNGSRISVYNGFTQLVSTPFLIAGSIFLFVGSYASFREDFNFLLAMNNTRHNQYWSSILYSLTMAALFVMICLFMGLIERFLGMVLTNQAIWRPETDWSFAATLSELILPFGLFLAANSFGRMAGALSYRLGAAFTVTFWIVFGLSFFIIPNLAGTVSFIGQFLTWFFGVGKNWPLLESGWHLVLLSLLFFTVSGVVVYRMPQNA